MKRETGKIVRKFDSVNEFSRCLNSRTNKIFESAILSSDGKDFSFYGTKDYDEANSLMKYGDKESYSLVSKELKRMNARGNFGRITRKRTCASVVGFAPIVPNALMGLPQTMMNEVKIEKPNNKIYTIVYNSTVSAFVDKNDIVKAGAALMNKILSIEAQGKRVNLFLMIAAMGNKQDVCFIVKIKDSGQYLDVLRCSYPVINPSFLRRHYFRFIETEKELTDKSFVNGYGRPIKNKRDAERFLKEANVKFDEYLNVEILNS